jgi:hypothetical protein
MSLWRRRKLLGLATRDLKLRLLQAYKHRGSTVVKVLRYKSEGRWFVCRSPWPRGLRHGSAVARMLGLWVRIPHGHGCLCVISVVCCKVEVSETS